MVSFTGGGGRGAKYTANISGGQIVSFNKIDGGADYSSAPTVKIASAGGDGTEHADDTIQVSPTDTQIIDTTDDPITVDAHAAVFGTVVTVGSGSAKANAVVDCDPTSSDFGKVKVKLKLFGHPAVQL